MFNKQKRLLSLLLAVVMLFSSWVIPNEKAYAGVALPSISSSKYISTYTYASSGKAYAYKEAGLKNKTGGYIACATDECRILEIKGQAVRVSYPISGGRKTAWFSREAFTYRDLASYGAKMKFKCTKKVTTYKWKNKGNTFGYISSGDTCYLVRGDSSSDWLQVIYPVSSGYKMGWVKGSDIIPVIWPVTTKITLNTSSVTLRGIGSTTTLRATVTPSNSSQGVSWTSSNNGVATVSGGTVKAVGAGNATITATSGSKSVSASVKVVVDTQPVTPTPTVVEPTGISLSSGNIKLTSIGQTYKLIANVSPANATDKSVSWSSNKTSVATVNSSGKVTAKNNGTAKITAKTKNGKTASITVTVSAYKGSPQKGSYNGKQFFVFSQRDKAWASEPYKKGTFGGVTQKTTVGRSACHLLSLVNATHWLSGKFIDPIWLARYAIKKGYRVNGGINMEGLYKDVCKNYGSKYGIKYRGCETGGSRFTELKKHIKKGEVAIGGGMGHVMAIVAYDSSKDKYLVLDSYGSDSRGTQKCWYIWKSKSQMKGKFGFTYFYFIGKR